MSAAKAIQSEINWTKAVHVRENSQANENHLNANRFHFTGQCAVVLSLLQQGVRLTSRSAMIQYHIGHLPRRLKDLKEAGVEIQEDWEMTEDGKRTRNKIWFIKKIDNV